MAKLGIVADRTRHSNCMLCDWWIQIKKFSELAAAYTVTAHEIGLISPKLDAVQTKSELRIFVNEAEQGFSREHTMWIARRTDY